MKSTYIQEITLNARDDRQVMAVRKSSYPSHFR